MRPRLLATWGGYYHGQELSTLGYAALGQQRCHPAFTALVSLADAPIPLPSSFSPSTAASITARTMLPASPSNVCCSLHPLQPHHRWLLMLPPAITQSSIAVVPFSLPRLPATLFFSANHSRCCWLSTSSPIAM
ncbi:hypothetical protein BHE74_00055326 [Ensete ventricosum]|nr:hypothetical protein BHE74_00055326 [Ensete ventricosum]